MKHIIIAGSHVGSFVIFSLVTNLFDSVVMFLLFGIIPGRNEPLSADQMLIAYGGCAVLLTSYGMINGASRTIRLVQSVRLHSTA